MSFVAFDTETTGIQAGSRLVEIAAIHFDAETGEILDQFESLSNPGIPMPPDAGAINGITTNEMLKAPMNAEVVARFLQWLPAETVLAAHNATFDTSILGFECRLADLPLPTHRVVDTRIIARLLAETPNNRLQTLIDHHGWKRIGEAHRALPDADAVRHLIMRGRMKELPARRFRGGAFSANWHPLEPSPEQAVLQAAMEMQVPVSLHYRNGQGYDTWRQVTPYGMARSRTGQVFHGYCHRDQNRRSFRLDRIVAIA